MSFVGRISPKHRKAYRKYSLKTKKIMLVTFLGEDRGET